MKSKVRYPDSFIQTRSFTSLLITGVGYAPVQPTQIDHCLDASLTGKAELRIKWCDADADIPRSGAGDTGLFQLHSQHILTGPKTICSGKLHQGLKAFMLL